MGDPVLPALAAESFSAPTVPCLVPPDLSQPDRKPHHANQAEEQARIRETLGKGVPPPPSEVPDPAVHGRGPTLAGGVDPGAVPRSTRFFAPGTLSSPRPLPPLSPRTVRLHFESPSPGRWLALALRCLHRGSGSPLFAGLPPEPMRLPRRPHRETPAMGGADRVNPREVGEAENSCCL